MSSLDANNSIYNEHLFKSFPDFYRSLNQHQKFEISLLAFDTHQTPERYLFSKMLFDCADVSQFCQIQEYVIKLINRDGF